MKAVGLYFGTFNPVHIGHVVIANYMANHTHLDEVWMVVTPHNPHKKREEILPDEHRLQMVRLAVVDNNRVWASDVEFSLPQPNFTINTLNHLEQTRPELTFTLIMGEDNLRTLHKWKSYEEIIAKYPILVYPRAITEGENPQDEIVVEGANIQVCDAPMIKISSTFLRNSILEHKDVRYLIPDKVIRYISNNYLYEEKPML